MNEYNLSIIIPFLDDISDISECISLNKYYNENKLNNLKKIINMWTLLNTNTDDDSSDDEFLNINYNKNILVNDKNIDDNEDKEKIKEKHVLELINNEVIKYNILKKNRFYNISKINIINNNSDNYKELFITDSDDSDDSDEPDYYSEENDSNSNELDDNKSNDNESSDNKSSDNELSNSKLSDNELNDDDGAYDEIKKMINEDNEDDEELAMIRQLGSVGITNLQKP
tara:strand:+ start:377 stop:1060 length:684 start_codon:yes stop_codon:yes gene_type:complete